MNTFTPLPSNASPTPTLYFNADAPADALLQDALRRVEAAKGLAATLAGSGGGRGIESRDLAAYALVTEILTSDAVALLEAMEHQFLTSQVKAVRHD